MTGRLLEHTDMVIDHLSVVGTEKPAWSIENASSLELDANGIVGDRHYGATRVMRNYQSLDLAGREVANDRQLSIAQVSDMEAIAAGLGLPNGDIEERSGKSIAQFMAEQLAINVLVDSPDARRLTDTAVSGLVLVLGSDFHASPAIKLSEYSRPCPKPVVKIVASLRELGLAPGMPARDLTPEFERVARTGRGWVGSVFAAGTVAVGDTVSMYASLLPKSLS